MAIYLIMGAVRELLTQPDNDPTHTLSPNVEGSARWLAKADYRQAQFWQ
jgi:hypothetical protein